MPQAPLPVPSASQPRNAKSTSRPAVSAKTARSTRSRRKAQWLRQTGGMRPGSWVALALLAACLTWGMMTWAGGNRQPAAAESSPPIPREQLRTVAHKPHPATPEAFQRHVGPFFEKYCFDCHANGAEEGGLTLDQFTQPEAFNKDRKTAEHVLKMINASAMPPEHGEQPTAKERQRVADWIDLKLYYVDCDLPPDPGRVTIRRLNRAEYNNTIRDLVGIDFEPAADFPSDEVGNGFDNIGDVLSLPPLLLEKYLTAAETIAKKAIVGIPERHGIQRLAGDKLERSGSAGGVDDAGFVSMASTGSVFGDFRFPATADYVIRAEAMADQAGSEPARMELRLDGKAVKVFDVKERRKPNVYETRVKVEAGRHKLEAAFINDFYDPKAKDKKRRDRNLYVRELEVVPTQVSLDALPESHRQIVFVRSDDNTPPRKAAEKILRRFMSLAFRRPALDQEVERFASLVELATNRDETFEQGIQVAVTAVLVSPHFLFRVEDHQQPDNPRALQQVADYELASRLSYFLWSSMPDEELFRLAEKGQLHESPTLERQVKRMLKDSKSQALVENFASQWLNLRNLPELSPDPKLFPAFNDQLRRDARKETEAFFAAVMREDLSVMDFLDADYSFVNERLATHYGIQGVKGDEFRKVSLAGLPRKGVLTQASILMLTSNPTRTSPVKRGKWIMENLLGESPPPPPPNVPELEDTAKEQPGLSIRQQLAIHRESPDCASCHVVMDPLGLGFENFDAIGRYRERDGKLPVDASGELPGGKKFNGPLELIQTLKTRQADFRRCLAEKMLTYALGRGLEHYDRCAVDVIANNLATNGDRFSTMVLEIVRSKPFLYRRGEKQP